MTDSHKNFAYSLVATAPSPASSGTSLVVTAAGGALFPAVPFNATVWPAGVQPTAANAEIVRVTARTSDTLTITRAQEGSSARTIVVGDQIAATITTKVITDAEAASQVLHGLQSFVVSLAQTIFRWAINTNTALLSTGRLSSASLPIRNGTPCTNASFLSATTAASVPTNWWFALCDSALNVVRQSTDQLTAAWAANTVKTLALDSIPVTAGARAASTTVTLTFPTLSESLTSLIAPGDSIVVSNANVAAYNGTFTVVTVSATQITYVCGGSATDSLAAPFPTVQIAAGQRVFTPTADGLYYLVIMMKATTPISSGVFSGLAGAAAISPVLVSSGQTSLTGTCPSPITTGTGSSVVPWGAIS